MRAVLAGVVAGLAVLVWPGPATSVRAAFAPPASAVRRRLRPRRSRRARRARSRAVNEALLVLDGIGPALRVGLAPRAALEHLASSSPVPGGLAHRLAAAAALPLEPGQPGVSALPVARVWVRVAQESEADELRLVATAWSLADVCGVALADAVDLAAALLRDSRARQARLDVLLAGPRATTTLLSALPLAGPLVGWVFGIDPVSLYAGSPVAVAAAVSGAALLLLGRLWCQALVRRALAAGGGSSRSAPGRADGFRAGLPMPRRAARGI